MEKLFIIILLSINSLSFGAESVDTELSRLLKDARTVPEINPDTGEIEGYRTEPRTHLLEAVLPGDVLNEVNGLQMKTPADAVQSFQNLNQNPREIQLTRDGKVRKIHSSENSTH